MPDFAVKTAFTATDKISPAFNRMGRGADKFGSKAQKGFMKADRGASKFMIGLKNMLPLFGGAALLAIGKNAIDLASDLTEVQNVVDVTFGKGAKQINDFANTAITKFGLSELKAKEFASTFGAIIKPAGITGDTLTMMAKNLTGLSGDFASFRNLRPEEAFEKLRAGITGETEPLKSLGIVMTQANLKAFALTQGITKNWKSMSQAEQTMLRYKFIMDKSKDAQGDFNRTLDTSYANQKRVLGVRFDQFLASVAVKILPTLTSAFEKMNSAIQMFNADKIGNALAFIVDLLPYLVGGFLAYKAALLGVAGVQAAIVAAGWIKYLAQMAPIMAASVKAQGLYNFLLKGTAAWSTILAFKTAAVTAAQWLWNAALLANPIGLVIAGVAALIFRINQLINQWEAFKKSFTEGGIVGLAAKFVGIASAEELNGAGQGAGVKAPNEGVTQNVNLEGNINIAGAPEGSTASSRVKGALPIPMNLIGANE